MELFGLMYLFLYLLGCHGEKAKNYTTIVNVKTKNSFVTSKRYCNCLGGRLVRRKTLNIHLTCLKQFLDTFEQYWIGTDNSKSEQGFPTLTLKQNKEPKFEARRSGFNIKFFSLCEVGESTFKNNRNRCKQVNKISLMTCSMSNDDALTTAHQTESITDVSNANRTTTMMSMEQSHDDGKQMESIAIVDVKKRESFVASKTHCKILGGRLARRRTLNEHIPCLKESLDTYEKYWIGKDEDCNATRSISCTFKLSKNKKPKFKKQRGTKKYFSLCEIDLSTYEDKKRLCPAESTTEASLSDRTITMMTMEQQYDEGPSVEVFVGVVCLLVATFAIVLTVIL